MPNDKLGVIVFVIGDHCASLYDIVSYNVYERLLGIDQTPWSERLLDVRLKGKKAGHRGPGQGRRRSRPRHQALPRPGRLRGRVRASRVRRPEDRAEGRPQALFASLAPRLAAQAQDPAVVKKLGNFDAYMEKVLKDWNVPGIGVGIVDGDKLVFAKGYGYRDYGKKLPFTPTTPARSPPTPSSSRPSPRACWSRRAS